MRAAIFAAVFVLLLGRSALARADQPRRNDLDGRGPLSEEDLVAFCKFFLECCRDQIDFMDKLLEPEGLRKRFQRFLPEGGTGKVVRQMFLLGEVKRGEVRDICGVKERQANKIVKQVLESGLAQSPSAYGPLRLKITTELALALFPDLA